MNKIVNRITIIFLLFCNAAAVAFSQSSLTADYDSFLQLNNIYIATSKAFLTTVQVIDQKGDNLPVAEYTYCLFHKQGQCVQIQTKSGIQYFFSTPQGYWIFNKKLRTPLKISGSYKIDAFEVQDILKTDFHNDYKIAGEEDGVLILERQTKKSSYSFILFRKTEVDIFELIFCDMKKNKIRKICYRSGTVSNRICFDKIDIYNLLFDKDTNSSWITKEIKDVSIPASLFSLSNITQLVQKLSALTE